LTASGSLVRIDRDIGKSKLLPLLSKQQSKTLETSMFW
jgi:hypothetical protein